MVLWEFLNNSHEFSFLGVTIKATEHTMPRKYGKKWWVHRKEEMGTCQKENVKKQSKHIPYLFIYSFAYLFIYLFILQC
jgi:hypothetical protein